MFYRSLLFTPGNHDYKMLKSLDSNADALIWDLEDAVHPDEKQAARETILRVLNQLSSMPSKPVYIRVNAETTPWFEEDVKLATHEYIRGIMLPKAETAYQVNTAWRILDGKKDIIIIAETAVGIRDLDDVLKSGHVSGVALGAIDLAVDQNLTLTETGLELVYARSRIVNLSVARGIRNIYDSVYPEIHDAEGLRNRAVIAKNSGFCGQLVIHPKQIDTVHEVYSPTPAEIEWAKRVIQAINQESKGMGVFTLDGKMIDKPVIDKAKQIYQMAQNFGMV
jgi:citrate lyase beta subunit